MFLTPVWISGGLNQCLLRKLFLLSVEQTNNANNNNIVNEHQNRWLIMKIGKCVQKQCLEEIWNDEQQQQQWMNEWTITWVIIQINKLSIQYSVRYRIIPIYVILTTLERKEQ